MRHLSNIYDHRNPKTRELFTGYTYHEWLEGEAAIERAWQRHLEWINENVIGPPKKTKFYSVKKLEEMGMIGIYSIKDLTVEQKRKIITDKFSIGFTKQELKKFKQEVKEYDSRKFQEDKEERNRVMNF